MMIEATTLATLTLLSTMGWLPSGHRWAPGSLPVPYCITANGTNTALNANQQRAAITQGINAWRATGVGGGISCTTYDAAPSAQACIAQNNGNDGRNEIFFEDNWQQGSSTIGVTWSVFFNNCGSVTDSLGQNHQLDCSADSDIELNDRDYFWTTNGTDTDIASIMTHEYGHFIGLDHCNLNGTCQIGSGVMYAAYPGGLVRVPFADDVAGACGLYPGTPGGVGWPCNANNQCNSNICVNPTSNGYCTATCGTCQQGYACGQNPQNAAQQVCLRDDGLNRALCELCQGGLPGACASSGICISGLPEANSGRCVTPCPNPGMPNGNCPSLYSCYRVNLGGGTTGDYCFPRSNDCTDLNNFTELMLGQACDGDPVCAQPLDCIGICSTPCTGGPGQGTCTTGFACETFNFMTGPEAYCAPPVGEGGNCEGIKACTVGPCLLSPQNIATCYRDCAGNPGACNNAQTCDRLTLSGGGQVSICRPPGVPPRPDGGILPDTGVVNPMDSGVACACNVSSACDPGCNACDPDCGAPPPDSGIVEPGDGGVAPGRDAQPAAACLCDKLFACEEGCPCDPECMCACDQSYDCDRGCEECDPECQEGKSTCACSSTESREDHTANALTTALVVMLLLLWMGKRSAQRGLPRGGE